MAALHLVNHAAALPACLDAASAGDAVLLIEDAVYGAVAVCAPARSLLALEADVHARGLSGRLAGTVKLVDDAGFVALVADYQPIVTWR